MIVGSGPTAERTVLFVCPHGAAKSRIAAAIFNHRPAPGWRATTAGTEPQDTIGDNAPRLLAGTPYEVLLDRTPPRPVAAVRSPELVVTIDCVPPAGTGTPPVLRWELRHREFDEALREEIRDRVQALSRALAGGGGVR